MQPGSLVKCVRNYHTHPKVNLFVQLLGLKAPVKECEYIVREVVEHILNGKLFIGLRLEELDNSHLARYFPQPKGVGEPAFCITGFVELQPPMELDIEELLKQANSMPMTEMLF